MSQGESTQAPPSRRASRWPRWGCLSAAAALGVALSLGWFPQELLRSRAEQALRQATGPASRIGRLRVVPARLSLEVVDLTVDTPALRLDVPRGRVLLSPRVFAGQIAVRELEVSSPTLTLRIGGTSGGQTPPPRRVSVGEIRVDDGAITVEGGGRRLALEAVAVRGAVGRGVLTVRSARGELRLPQPLALEHAAAELEISESLDVKVLSAEVAASKSRLTADGRILSLGRSLDLNLTGSIADLGAFVASSAGQVEVEARIGGTAPELRGNARLVATRPTFGPLAADRLEAHLRFDGDVASGDVVGTAMGGRLQARGELRGSAVRGHLAIDGADLARIAGAAGLPADSAPGGSGAARLDVRGDVRHDLALRGSLRADAPSVSGLSIGVTAEGHGTYRVPDRTCAFAWTADADGQRVAGSATALAAARLHATGSARGAFPPPVEVDLAGSAVIDGPKGANPVTLRGNLRGDVAELAATLESRGFGGSVSALLEAERGAVKRLHAEATSIELSRLLDGSDGVLRWSLDAAGPWRSLRGTSLASVEGAGWRGISIGRVSASTTGTPQRADFVLDAPDVRASARARFDGGSRPTISGAIELDDTPLDHLEAFAAPGTGPIEARVSASVRFDVPLSDPSALHAEGQARQVVVKHGGFEARAAEPFLLHVEAGHVGVDGLHLEGLGVAARASGVVGFAGARPMDVRLSVDADLAKVPRPAELQASGRLRGEASIGGTVAAPQATGVIAVEGVELQWPRLAPLKLADTEIQIAGDRLVFPRIDGELAGGHFEASAAVPFSASSANPARARVSWSGIDLSGLLSRPDLSGAVAGELILTSDLRSVTALDAQLTLPQTALRVGDVDVVVEPASITLRDGRARTERLSLRTGEAAATLSGGADLSGRTWDVRMQGGIDLRALSALMEDVSVSGRAEADLVLQGPLDAPVPRGRLRVADGGLRLRMLRQAITALDADLALEGDRLRLDRASAELGGGSISASGQGRLAGLALEALEIDLSGRDIALRYPAGFQSRVETDVRITGRPGAFLVSGKVRAERGVYDLGAALSESLRVPAAGVSESPALRAFGLDLDIVADDPVRVRSELLRLEAGGRLRLTGDLERPEPQGRFEIVPGGRLTLHGREFLVDQGRLEYRGSWDPDFELSATCEIPHEATRYQVGLTLSGSIEKPNASFRSTPPLPTEAEVLSLVLTGQPGSGQALRAGAIALGEQAAALVSGRVSEGLTRRLRAIGLDRATIQPELLARDSDPGARFTFEKDLTPWLSLLYSLSLNSAEERFVKVEAHPGRDVQVSAQRNEDGTYALGAGQRFELLGPRRPADRRRGERIRLEKVDVEVARPGDPALVRLVRLERGRRVSAFEVQEEADRVRNALRRRQHVEAEVTGRLDGTTARFELRPGPRFEARVVGLSSPPDLSKALGGALFEEEALGRCEAELLRALHDRGHVRAEVESRVISEAEVRVLQLTARPGPVFRDVEVRFVGASALSERNLLEAAGGAAGLLARPEEAREALRAAYRAAHFDAEVGLVAVEEDGRTLRIRVPIREGPRPAIAAVRFEGSSLADLDLQRVAALRTDRVPTAPELDAAAMRVRDHYFGLGYAAVRVRPSLRSEAPGLEVVLEVVEGPKLVVGDVTIRGLTRTRESVVRRVLRVRPGDPVDPRRLADAERRLAALGVFTRVHIGFTAAAPSIVTVDAEEKPMLAARYDVRYNDERGVSALGDAEARNLLGVGLTLGGRHDHARDAQESRASVFLPSLGRLGSLTASAFRLAETLEAGTAPDGTLLTSRRLQRGFQLQQTVAIGPASNLLYGYRFKRATTTTPFFDFTIDLGSLDLSLIRDTRDSSIDPSRGRFLSVNVELSPERLGSELTFVKGFVQLFDTRRILSTLVWAQGARLGLAHTFGGQVLVSTERFTAGGPNSVRGYPTGALGPVDPIFGEPAGGEAVLVFNEELRYMHRRGFGAVAFYDAGNVFASASGLSLALRHAVGIGVRWASPVGLLRLDLGFPLGGNGADRRPRLFFGFGQAF